VSKERRDVIAAQPAHVVELNSKNESAVLAGVPVIARKALILLTKMPYGTLTVRLPDGKAVRVGGNAPGPDAEVVLHNWRLPRRAISGATIGVAESYMDGDWESPDVTSFLELFLVNYHHGEKLAGGSNWLINVFQRLRHWLNDNTHRGSRRNIAAHYDLGNEFYKAWLDRSMTYSSAIYSSGANDLESAQIAKYRALALDMGIREGDSVLEIGSGWGGFAEFAAQEMGARVTGLTISREQLNFARERIDRAGLSDRVTFKFQDYRDENGRYDHIASIEMFEAVGERHWPAYFSKLKQCLKPGGNAGIQVITMNHNAFEIYRKRPDFIQRYIFPGGMLPSPDILKSLGSEFGLGVLRERVFPQDYARTLAEWRERFRASWSRIVPLGFDERFRKMWEFYLHYCEAGFRSEYIDVRQVIYKA
jgi:cyclopropane-fatty-acyl-phospholipid synthase